MDRSKSRYDSLTKLTTDTLRQMIVEGVLSLGETLSESKVALLLDVSRTPVREAFARLEIEGLVFSEPQRRTRVFLPGPGDVDDICDVRCWLEKKALALAMTRSGRALVPTLSEAAKRMADAVQTGNVTEYLRVDSQFHQAFFDCAGNVFLNDAYQTIAAKVAALRTRLATRPDYLMKGFGEHLRLCELVDTGDIEGALNVLEEHLSRKEDSFWHLNEGLAEIDVWRRKPERLANETAATNDALTQFDRRNQFFNSGLFGANPVDVQAEMSRPDEKSIDKKLHVSTPMPVIKSGNGDKKIDEKATCENIVDENNRGRPRVHADDAARKRAWAARERARKKAEGLAAGQSKKRGRPRKHASHAERQKAYEERRR